MFFSLSSKSGSAIECARSLSDIISRALYVQASIKPV